jgi:lambda family phage portal protein
VNRIARLLIRAAGLDVRSYEAARLGAPIGRGRSNPHFGNWSSETISGSPTIRSRSRHAYANDGIFRNGIEAIKTTAVGAGFVATPQHPTDTTREAIRTAWSRYALNCDADGRTDFAGFTLNVVQGIAVDGEALVHLQPDGMLRQLTPEQLDASDTRELGEGRRIIGGVEFAADGRRIAYHVRPFDVSGMFDAFGPTVRIDAADICHVFRADGPGQVRGVPWGASVLVAADALDQTEYALLTGIKVAAMHAGIITDQNNVGGGLPYEGAQLGSILESGLEPATLKVLPGGYDIKFSSPQQAQQAAEFLKHQLRRIAAGLGVPEYLLSGDLSNANYSSLRAALVEFRSRVEQWQFSMLVPQFLRPVWERFVTLAVLSGELDAPDFEASMAAYFAVEWIPPAMPWVDPAKDAEATATMIAAGLTSRRRAVAAQGYSVEELDAEIVSDRAREAALGVSFNRESANAA